MLCTVKNHYHYACVFVGLDCQQNGQMMAPAAGNCTLAAPSVADSCHSSCRSCHTAVQDTACSVAVLRTEQNDGCCCVEERFGCTHHHHILGNTVTKCLLDEDYCNPSSQYLLSIFLF